MPFNEQCKYSGENQIVELPNGNLRCFFRNNSNRITYVDAVKKDAFLYSCMTVTKDGNIAMLYESEVGEITFATYQLSDLSLIDVQFKSSYN